MIAQMFGSAQVHETALGSFPSLPCLGAPQRRNRHIGKVYWASTAPDRSHSCIQQPLKHWYIFERLLKDQARARVGSTCRKAAGQTRLFTACLRVPSMAMLEAFARKHGRSEHPWESPSALWI